jgi:hypothetical protein
MINGLNPFVVRLYAIELIIHHFSCNWASKQYNILLSNSRTTDAITLSLSAVGLSRDPFNTITLSLSAVGLSCDPFNTNCTQVGA